MAETQYQWTDNPTESGIADCNTDVLNDCLMHLKYDNNGASRNIGEIVASIIPLTDAGLHLLDGAWIELNGSYREFVEYILSLYSSYPNLFTDETGYNNYINTYGVCGRFYYDEVNQRLRLPKITGKLDGTTDLNTLGDLEPLFVRLPNITGGFTARGIENINMNAWGAFAAQNSGDTLSYGHDNGAGGGFNFYASRSSSVYSGDGTDTTIHEQAVKVLYYIVVATSTKTKIEVDIDEIATDLNGKADVDLSNINTTGKQVIAINSALSATEHVDITPIAGSGNTYVSHVNGVVCFCANVGTSTWCQFSSIDFSDTNRILTACVNIGGLFYILFPVYKGQKYKINYDGSIGSPLVFREISSKGDTVS